MRSVLAPRSVAVIGASRRRGTVGGEILHNLLAGGFEGIVYPVNPSADVVQSMPAYRSVGDVPDQVELAVIAVPARGRRGRRARVRRRAACAASSSISAGFAETGAEGVERQRELARGVPRRTGCGSSGPTASAC